MRAVIAFLALSGAAAFAPAPAQRSATALNAYVPDGLSAAQWKKMQADKKKNAAANKLKYPKGAAQVVGVKEYLEDLAKKQTFFRDAAGNSRVGGSKGGVPGGRATTVLARGDNFHAAFPPSTVFPTASSGASRARSVSFLRGSIPQ